MSHRSFEQSMHTKVESDKHASTTEFRVVLDIEEFSYKFYNSSEPHFVTTSLTKPIESNMDL